MYDILDPKWWLNYPHLYDFLKKYCKFIKFDHVFILSHERNHNEVTGSETPYLDNLHKIIGFLNYTKMYSVFVSENEITYAVFFSMLFLCPNVMTVLLLFFSVCPTPCPTMSPPVCKPVSIYYHKK